MTKTVFRVLGLVASLIVGGAAMASNDLIAFCQGNNNAGSLKKIDPVTGVSTSLYQFYSFFTPGTFVASANNSYYLDGNRGDLMKINMLTGEVSVLTAYPNIRDVRGIQIAKNGDLICICEGLNNAGSLWKIDPVTGIAVSLYQFPELRFVTGTFVTSFNNCYFKDNNRGDIKKINMLTGQVSVLVNLPNTCGLQVAQNGDLISLCQGFNNSGSLWKIDPVTGIAIQLPCSFSVSTLSGCFVVIDNIAYIGNNQDGNMYKIDLSSFSIATLPQPLELRALGSTAPIAEIPVVTYVQPISGPASGGTAVNINGVNFPNSVSVLFGGVAATDVVVVSPTLITAVTPAGVSGMSVVTVNGVGGEAFYYRSICQSDLDGSGGVDSSDLGILLLDFGSCGESAAVAPQQQEPLILQSIEPATPVLNKK
jgi:hypothetical protein